MATTKAKKTLYWIKGNSGNPTRVLDTLRNAGFRIDIPMDLFYLAKFDDVILYGVEGITPNYTFSDTTTYNIVTSAGVELKS